MDIAPTVLDLFGVDVPAHMDGETLVVADANGSSAAPPAQLEGGDTPLITLDKGEREVEA